MLNGKSLYHCGLKLRRKPNKQPPQFFCNICKQDFTLFNGELVKGKRKNLANIKNKLYVFDKKEEIEDERIF